MEKIKKTSEQSRAKLRRASAQSLPDRPTAAGMKPDDLRRALWNPMLGEELSLLSEQDRIVDETNKALSEVEDAIESERASRVAAINDEWRARVLADNDERADRERAIDELGQHEDAREAAHDAEEASYREGIAAELDARVKVIPSERMPGIYGQVGETTQLYPLEFAPLPRNTVVMRSPNGCIYTETDDEEYEIYDDVNHLAVGKRYRVVNIKYLQDELKKSVTPRLDALETALSGTARSYVIEDLAELSQLVNGELLDFDVFDLITGDNILLRQKDAPDFWFESARGKAAAQAPVYTHTEYDGEGNVISKTDYRLSVIVGDEQIGVLHVLESDYSLIEGKAISAGKAAQEAQAAAQEAQAAIDDAQGKADARYVKKTDTASSYVLGLVKINKGYGVNIQGGTGVLAIQKAASDEISAKTNNYKPIVPSTLDYAIKSGLTKNALKLTDAEKEAAQEWLGIKQTNFTAREGATVTKPAGAKRYAQIKEIGGARASYLASPSDVNLWDFVANDPTRIVTDTGTVLFELSEEALAQLPDFGLDGNYIYFEDGIAYYKQTTKREAYDYEPKDREAVVEQIVDGGSIVRMDEIITDVSAYINFDGMIDTSGATSFSVEMRYSEEDIQNRVLSYNGVVADNDYDYRLGKMRIAFEV